ncbi:hypothetical protein GTO10_01990 [Candidatus Saccharibacteria bacterium]|nr:hypothetical protein [Candidatus Saccharibacteria bacterium]
MNIPRKPLVLLTVLLFLILGSAPQVTAATTVCPQFKSGSLSPSDVATNPNELKEDDVINKACSQGGLIGFVTCVLAKLFADYTGPGNLNLQDSQMPPYLRRANRLALSGDPTSDEPGELNGSIARVLAPNYRQDDRDPLEELTKSEGQLVTGTIILNNRALQKGFTTTIPSAVYEDTGFDPNRLGYYDLQLGAEEEAVANYDVQGRFGEVSPLYDRFGLLKQALVPFTQEVADIPDLDKDCSAYDPSTIVVTPTVGFADANPHRVAPWTAYQPVPEEDAEEERLPCETDEDGNITDCPDSAGEFNYEIGGNLDTQTEVSYASDAWERIGAPSTTAGGGGVLNVLLPPGKFFMTEQAKPLLNYVYDPHSEGKATYNDSSNLHIADLGNVGSATSCIYDQLTAHPANAAVGACEAAFGPFAGFPIVCTDEATPLEFPNTMGGIAGRAWEIVNNLYQGFWCLWNWSKDDYPQYFDEAEYARNPNPPYPPDKFINMFWCTRLVNTTHGKSYSLLSNEMAKSFGAIVTASGGTETYSSGGRFIAARDATWHNLQPGYAVFFRVSNATSWRINHVGIVYSVTQDAIRIVHSNAATKSLVLPVGDDGRIQSAGGFKIEGFGRP